MNSLLVLRIGQNWHLKLVHFLWILMKKLLKEVDFLGVSLLCSGRSLSDILEVALGMLDLRKIQIRGSLGLWGRCGICEEKVLLCFLFYFSFEPSVSYD